MGCSIGKMAERLGVPTSTIRYYESEGLLSPGRLRAGGTRVFSEEDYERLFLILCLKKMGLSIADIREYVQLEQQGDATIQRRSRILRQQRADIEERIAELSMILRAIDYKCWLFEKAKVIGHEAAKAEMMAGNVPQEHIEARAWWLGIDNEKEGGQ